MASPKVKGSIANGTSPDRCPDDFYATPPGFTQLLLDCVTFNHQIWEPTAGDGAISDVLEGNSYNVWKTDLKPRRQDVEQLDLLSFDGEWSGDIILNPPFRNLIPVIKACWDMLEPGRSMAFVGPLSVVNSSSRYQAIWSVMAPRMLIVAPRYQHIRCDRGVLPSQFTHLWCVLEKEYIGPCNFIWGPDTVYKG